MKTTLILTFIPFALLAVPVGPTLENPKIKNVSAGSASNAGLLKVDPATGALTYVSATSASIGLGNVDNTSDVNKPVSSAQQTALNLKANLASPTFTGSVTLAASTPLNLGAGSDVYFGSNGTLHFDPTSIFSFSGASAGNFQAALGLGNAATLTVDANLATFVLPASTTISAFGATLTDDADAATARTTLGLGALATTTPAAGVATFLATPTSANLATAVTDETGLGLLVFQTTPTFKTSVKINNPADTFAYTLTPAAIAADRILNLPLITGTDTLATLGLAQTWTGTQSFADSQLKLNGVTSGSTTLKAQAIASTYVVTLPAATDTLVGRTTTDTLTNKTLTSPTINSGTLVTPILGTPQSGSLGSCTGYSVSNLSGTGAGVLNWLATPSSSNLISALTDETGSGESVFSTAPLFKTTINLNNPANTFKYVITPAAIVADRTLNLPLITATDTLASLGLSQTFTGAANYITNGTSGGTWYSYASGAGKYLGINATGMKLFCIDASDINVTHTTSTVHTTFQASGNVLKTTGGRIKLVTVDTSTSLTLTNAHHVVTLSNAGAVTLNLPVGVTGTEYIIKNKGAGTVTITPNGSQKLFTTAQVATFTRTTGQACIIIFDGTDWSVVSDY